MVRQLPRVSLRGGGGWRSRLPSRININIKYKIVYMARYLDSLVTVLRLEITVVQWHNVNDKGNINILSAAEEVIWKL